MNTGFKRAALRLMYTIFVALLVTTIVLSNPIRVLAA